MSIFIYSIKLPVRFLKVSSHVWVSALVQSSKTRVMCARRIESKGTVKCKVVQQSQVIYCRVLVAQGFPKMFHDHGTMVVNEPNTFLVEASCTNQCSAVTHQRMSHNYIISTVGTRAPSTSVTNFKRGQVSRSAHLSGKFVHCKDCKPTLYYRALLVVKVLVA